MEKLSRKNQLIIGLTLFSMFFGAGNLIFPPTLGAQAGTAALWAFLGFAVSAIGLPVLGVAAVARTGGLPVLAGRAGKAFSAVFVMLIYLSIGPCLAIPRTASTSFEMAVTPFVGASPLLWLMRTGYSVVFFGAALAMALHPTRLRDWLGKRLSPILLVLIAVLFFGCVFSGLSGSVAPQAAYRSMPAMRGFVDGYQTMDAMAALIFGIVLAMNIRSLGLTDTGAVVRSTIKAGWLAGGLFALVYGALSYIGVLTAANADVPADANGAALLTAIASLLFGRTGQAILAAIFVIACLNTCTGLICCCAEYFAGLFPRFSYTVWAWAFAVVSGIIANAGLDVILKFSVPVLSCLYPIAIVLIFFAFLPARLAEQTHLYPCCVGFTAAASLLYQFGAALPGVSAFFGYLPLAAQGLSWVSFAVLGAAVGLVWRRRASV